MKVKSEREVTESCPTLSDPMDCSPPGSSVRGIFQTIVLEWGAIAFSAPQKLADSKKTKVATETKHMKGVGGRREGGEAGKLGRKFYV